MEFFMITDLDPRECLTGRHIKIEDMEFFMITDLTHELVLDSTFVISRGCDLGVDLEVVQNRVISSLISRSRR